MRWGRGVYVEGEGEGVMELSFSDNTLGGSYLVARLNPEPD